jgi:hypothetical protein
MNEEVHAEDLQDGHLADWLIERVAWAICDASDGDLNSHGERTIVRSRENLGHHGSLATPTGRTPT